MTGHDAADRRPLTEDERHGAALASLGASPAVLRRLLSGWDPVDAWQALGRGTHRADPAGRYSAKATSARLQAVSEACARSGAAVVLAGRPGYPEALLGDRERPAVLFAQGDLGALTGRPRVAIVGTRSATPYGTALAAELGDELARAGVVVVSGAARGIDAAAHGGALGVDTPGSAPTVAVLGDAFDAATARRQVALRRELACRGLVLSEIPPGVHSARWWFAVRNRVMAALAHLVVVVECHAAGGSLYTVDAALERGVTVGAVPGSVRSPASRGTNRLLAEGATVVRDADDVLVALELAVTTDTSITPPTRGRAGPGGIRPRRGAWRGGVEEPSTLGPEERTVHGGLDHDPATLDTIVLRCGLPLPRVSLALHRLVDAGLAVDRDGWWTRPG